MCKMKNIDINILLMNILRRYRTIKACGLRSKIFRQVVQKFCRLAITKVKNFLRSMPETEPSKACATIVWRCLNVLTRIFGVFDGKIATENCAMV